MEIKKNEREVIRVGFTEWQGEKYIDIRAWVKTFDDRGYIRTKKGLTVKPEIAEALCRSLQGVLENGDNPENDSVASEQL